MFSKRSLLTIQELNSNEILFLFALAKAYSTTRHQPQLLEKLSVINLFLEPSTRTRVSFEMAARELGARVLNFTSSSSSIKKGETLKDTARNLVAMNPHCIIVRHPSAGSPVTLASFLKVPLVNAGDGFHEHPTQALLDVYTMQETLGHLAGKKIVILGDIAHSRVARSNIYALKKLGARVTVCGPPTLMPPEPNALGVEYAYRPEKVLPDADVVMTLRIQFERQGKMQIPSLSEYARYWGLNKEREKLLKKEAIILHPGPVNRGVELDPEVADSKRSFILNQVSNGIFIRMAVLSALCVPEKVNQWLRESEHGV